MVRETFKNDVRTPFTTQFMYSWSLQEMLLETPSNLSIHFCASGIEDPSSAGRQSYIHIQHQINILTTSLEAQLPLKLFHLAQKDGAICLESGITLASTSPCRCGQSGVDWKRLSQLRVLSDQPALPWGVDRKDRLI